MRRPLSSTSRTIGEFDKVDRRLLMRRKPLTEKGLHAKPHYSMASGARASEEVPASTAAFDRRVKIGPGQVIEDARDTVEHTNRSCGARQARARGRTSR